MPKKKTETHKKAGTTKKKVMDKVKIKRVKRNKKEITTAEKIMAGIGVGSTLLGGASAVAPKQNQTQFVSTQENNNTSSSQKIKAQIGKIFGSAFGVSQAKAAGDLEIGAEVKQVTGDQGAYTIGTVNGQSVALLDGAIYDASGQDITSNFTQDQLSQIQSNLANPSNGGSEIVKGPSIEPIDKISTADATGAEIPAPYIEPVAKVANPDSPASGNLSMGAGISDGNGSGGAGAAAAFAVATSGPAVGGSEAVVDSAGPAVQIVTGTPLDVAKYTDAQLLAGINSIPYTGSSDIPDAQLTRIQPQVGSSTFVTPGTVLAFMLGLGSDSPASGTQRGVYAFNGTSWAKSVVAVEKGVPVTQTSGVKDVAGAAAASVTGTLVPIKIGSIIDAKSGPQGNYTVGTIDGKTVAVMDGIVYDSTGKNINSTFTASQLAEIVSKFSKPTEINGLSIGTGNADGSGSGGAGKAVGSASGTIAATVINVGNLNSVTYQTSLDPQISALNLTATQLTQLSTQAVVPGTVLAFMLGLGNDSPASGTTRSGYTFSGATWSKTPQAAETVLNINNLNSVTYKTSLDSQINTLNLSSAQIATLTAQTVKPGTVLAFMLGLGSDSPATGTVRTGYTYNGTGWIKTPVGSDSKGDQITLTAANINTTTYSASLNSQISALKVSTYPTAVNPGSVLAFMLGLGTGSNLKSGDTVKASDGNTYSYDGKVFNLVQAKGGDKADGSDKTAVATFTVVTGSGKSIASGDIGSVTAPDSITVSIKGAAANKTVLAFAGYKGGVALANEKVGTTDANGNFTYTKNIAANEEGGWNYVFAVDGVKVGAFGFNVIAPQTQPPITVAKAATLVADKVAPVALKANDISTTTKVVTPLQVPLTVPTVTPAPTLLNLNDFPQVDPIPKTVVANLKIDEVASQGSLNIADVPKPAVTTNLNINDVPKPEPKAISGLNINDVPKPETKAVSNLSVSDIPKDVVVASVQTSTGGLQVSSVSSGGGGGSGGSYSIPFRQVSTLGAATGLAQGLQMPTGLQMPDGYDNTDPQPAEAKAVSQQGSYTVKKGDTLWSISKKVYGDGKQWRKILAANTKSLSKAGDTRTLKIGAQLVIPKI